MKLSLFQVTSVIVVQYQKISQNVFHRTSNGLMFCKDLENAKKSPGVNSFL